MKTRCPACGAENSLDSLVANDDARQFLKMLVALDDGLVRLAVRYLGLFRPARRPLSWDRMSRLLGEIVPDIQAGIIRRNGVEHPAPIAAWIYGFHQVIDARNSGCLKLPLTTHGYLYEVISRFKGDLTPIQQGLNQAVNVREKQSKTMSALEKLAGLQ